MRLVFELEGGWLVADIVEPGWAKHLSEEQAQTLAAALRGFFKAAGVDILRQQLAAQLPDPTPPTRITPEGLLVWPDEEFKTEVIYRFNHNQQLIPEVTSGLTTESMPILQRTGLLFREEPILWEDWVAAWQQRANPPQQA